MAPCTYTSVIVSLITLAYSTPFVTPTAIPTSISVVALPPAITPSPSQNEPTKILQRKNILNDVGGLISSALGKVGSDLPSYIASGVPDFFQHFPSGSAVQSSLSIQNSDLAPVPTQVLNIPPYANWTDQGWNVRFHGNVYKKPNISIQTLNSLANVFLVGTSIDQLQPSEQDQARNLTAEIFVVQQANQSVSMNIQPPRNQSSNITQGSGGTAAQGGGQSVVLPYLTTDEGDFDVFVPIQSNGLIPGNQTQVIQKLNVYANGSDLGNATAYLVPPTGLTVISDIDDVLRITKIYIPKEGILNTFARPFTPWLNMPDIYANWSRNIPNLHFHYLTTTPEQITANYMDFIYKTYPLGSFDTRPLNFSDVDATLSIRKYLLIKMFESFPQRKFVLVADTSNSDVMKDYPLMATMYPTQVQCILLRNTSATDQDYFPYDTSGFKNISQNQFMFFIQPDDLTGLDIVGGNCYNASIKQNVTFGTQDELLGIHNSASALRTSGWAGTVLMVLSGVFLLI